MPGECSAHAAHVSRPGLSAVQAQVAEVKAVSDAMAADPDALAGTGVTVAGVKYMYIGGDKQQVYAKKVTCMPWLAAQLW